MTCLGCEQVVDERCLVPGVNKVGFVHALGTTDLGTHTRHRQGLTDLCTGFRGLLVLLVFIKEG